MLKVGQTWRIIPNETYPEGWTGTIQSISGELVFWTDSTHTKAKYIQPPHWQLVHEEKTTGAGLSYSL